MSSTAAPEKKRIALLGATGSIGKNALRVIRSLKNEFKITVLAAAGNDLPALAEAASEFHVPHVAVADETKYRELCTLLPETSSAYAGMKAITELAASDTVDLVLCAIVGIHGIRPVLAAIEAGKTVALASKEVLVAAGETVMERARKKGVRILPVDSEHSAVFQCLEQPCGGQARPVRIILTASGGPFLRFSPERLAEAVWADAMNHPTWSMGPKVTLDSATLMNKALEMIEARHLFRLEPEQIDVLVHPQSVVHSLVEWPDGSLQAQLGAPDMRLPIQYALTFPRRLDTALPRLNLAATGTLTFEAPDEERFPSLAFARRAMHEGGTMGAVMNAANESAAERFRTGAISLHGLWRVIEQTMDAHTAIPHPGFEEIAAAHRWARSFAASVRPGLKNHPLRPVSGNAAKKEKVFSS